MSAPFTGESDHARFSPVTLTKMGDRKALTATDKILTMSQEPTGTGNDQMPGASVSWDGIIASLADGQDLTKDQARWAMTEILEDRAPKETIKSLLLGVQAKGETPSEVESFVEVMYQHCAPISISERAVDPVGTGGDGANTINISTTAAIIARAAGAKVVKHGARAASSMSGAADLLEALGVNIDLNGEQVAACFSEIGIGFCFAPKFHPAMRFAAPARKELGQASVFNILGPLANPARPASVSMGVSKARVIPIMADVLEARGTEGFLFRGDDGIDEITLTTTTSIVRLSKNGRTEEKFDPRDLGIAFAPIEALAGGDAQFNAQVTLGIFAGEKSPARDAVLLNAAAALAAYEGDFEGSITEQIARAYQKVSAAVDSGEASRVLEQWVELSQSFKSGGALV